MSYAITTEDVASLLDALGQPGHVIRWGQPTAAELLEELDATQLALEHAETNLGNLEELLCKRCSTKWHPS